MSQELNKLFGYDIEKRYREAGATKEYIEEQVEYLEQVVKEVERLKQTDQIEDALRYLNREMVKAQLL